ncbi:hypothetical protein R1flu_017103 [Riccia fluitans]|uniref:Uncharacterized protein n=1 Tax=Riccia fluitans TaxID=41844 RepID=A0ABD1YNR6_9MARC
MRECCTEVGEPGTGLSEQKEREKEHSLAPEKKAPRRCASFLLCCCNRPHNQASVREMDKEEALSSVETPMVSSAAMPLPPPVPVTAFMDAADETVQPSNGHSTGPVPVQPQVKLPVKSNLRRHSMFAVGSPQHQPLRHSRSQGPSDQNNGSETDGNGPVGVRSPQRQTSKVRWTDRHGKDLTEVWEFEPSETGDSDDEDTDSDSSQACTCVIQ